MMQPCGGKLQANENNNVEEIVHTALGSRIVQVVSGGCILNGSLVTVNQDPKP